MTTFQSLRVHSPGDIRLENLPVQKLEPGQVSIELHYSSVNYKDALAITGRGKILKQFPLVAGIDAAGIILESADSRFKVGQEVLVTGCGIGESINGGYARLLQVHADYVVARPKGLSLRETMILGTAGFTAALALTRMLKNGQTQDLGPILITGASGGVGSFAIQIFKKAGFEVHAVTGKKDLTDYLINLGADKVFAPESLNLGARPLESARFGGAVDNVGGEMLAKIIAHTQLWGNVASIGLAASHELHTTVMPFILRGVSLLGASSNNCPMQMRNDIWNDLATNWRPKHLEQIVTRTVGLKDIPLASADLIDRKIHGRILVDLRSGGSTK